MAGQKPMFAIHPFRTFRPTSELPLESTLANNLAPTHPTSAYSPGSAHLTAQLEFLSLGTVVPDLIPHEVAYDRRTHFCFADPSSLADSPANIPPSEIIV